MRYSKHTPVEPSTFDSRIRNHEFFRKISERHAENELSCAVLLVGANDVRSVSMREAQKPLRMDQRASKWSHAALILRFRKDDLENSAGLEVSFDPENLELQVPERNGVTPFRLGRYLNDARYRNLAALVVVPSDEDGDLKRRLFDASRSPLRNRERFPTWEQLAVWARYSYAPHLYPNPLLEGVPMPCAAFLEYVFTAAGVDLAPGATGNHGCPELLWATMQKWSDVLGPRGSLASYALVRDNAPLAQEPLPHAIELA